MAIIVQTLPKMNAQKYYTVVTPDYQPFSDETLALCAENAYKSFTAAYPSGYTAVTIMITYAITSSFKSAPGICDVSLSSEAQARFP